MFWRFGFHPVSAIDSLLDKESVTLPDLFELEEILQECKSQNSKLVEFLSRPQTIQHLLDILLLQSNGNDKELEPSKRIKYPYLAMEVLCCDIHPLLNGILNNPEIFIKFWGFIDSQAPLNDLQASYFARLNIILLQKNTTQTLSFIKELPDIIPRILKHLGTAAISDLIMKMISLEEIESGQGTIQWLNSQGLILKLIQQLDPKLDKELHINAAQTILDIIAISYQSIHSQQQQQEATPAEPSFPSRPLFLANHLPSNELLNEMKSVKTVQLLVGYMLDRTSVNSTSSITQGVSIFMELIRRYCTNIEQIELQNQEYTISMQQNGRSSVPPPSLEIIQILATDISGLLNVLCSNMDAFTEILKNPKDVTGPLPTTLGLLEPLGSERLKICELFAEFIHLQYLFTSSPLFEGLVQVYVDESTQEPLPRVIDALYDITECLTRLQIFTICLDLFFKFKWNNLLHSVVFDMIAKMSHSFSFTLSVPGYEASNAQQQDPSLSLAHEMILKVHLNVKNLLLTLFDQGELLKRIVQAQKTSQEQESKVKGVRLGNMGHLTYIADEAIKIYEKSASELGEKINAMFEDAEWKEYVSGPFAATKERDTKTLGGVRPDYTSILPSDFGFSAMGMSGFPIDDPDMIPPTRPSVKSFGDELTLDTHRSLKSSSPFSSDEAVHQEKSSGFSGELVFLNSIPKDDLFPGSKSEHEPWSVDFDSVFRTKELQEALESEPLSSVFPEDEWSEFKS